MLIDYEKLAKDFASNGICVVNCLEDISLEEQKFIVSEFVSGIGLGSLDFLTIKGMNHINLDTDFKNEGFYSDFFKKRIHIDLPRFNNGNELTSMISMCMKVFECSEQDGNTYFLNMRDVLKKLSFDTKDLLDIKISFIHDGHEYVSPVIFTHQIFNEDILFWPTANVKLLSGDLKIFTDLKNKVQKAMSDYSNWYEHKWSVNDLVIFDNPSMLHAFTAGWTKDQRIFNQTCYGSVTPFYFNKGVDIWKNWNDTKI